MPADLIAMLTAGHEGVVDALRGSTSEQILRHSPCPVLAVPDAWVTAVASGRRREEKAWSIGQLFDMLRSWRHGDIIANFEL
jgi:hypothetical protein